MKATNTPISRPEDAVERCGHLGGGQHVDALDREPDRRLGA